MSTLRGNALIGQSGGPTAVINQSLVGFVKEMLRTEHAGEATRVQLGEHFFKHLLAVVP